MYSNFPVGIHEIFPKSPHNDVARYKLKDGSEKQALLNEDDMLWVNLRHKHIAEVGG